MTAPVKTSPAPGEAGEKPVKSPCVSVCALNADDICEGCFRSGTEITRWGAMGNDERRAVLRSCNERARQMGRIW